MNALEYNQEKQRRDKKLWSQMSEEKWEAERKRIQRRIRRHFEEITKNGK